MYLNEIILTEIVNMWKNITPCASLADGKKFHRSTGYKLPTIIW
jgi:hypothetical protein